MPLDCGERRGFEKHVCLLLWCCPAMVHSSSALCWWRAVLAGRRRGKGILVLLPAATLLLWHFALQRWAGAALHLLVILGLFGVVAGGGGGGL